MKKKLQAELINIAQRILSNKKNFTLPQLKEETRLLYEKLSVLDYVETHFNEPQPTVGQIKVVLDNSFESENRNREKEPVSYIERASEEKTTIPELQHKPETKEFDFSEPETQNKPELIIEKINADISEDLFVPVSTEKDSITPKTTLKYSSDKNKETTGGANKNLFAQDRINNSEDKPMSLNEQLKKGIHIGLNDRLAFIKHLFEGSSTDYNRVLSQLNTLNNLIEAKQFIQNMVKPDYDNWEGKEEYEERFMIIVQNKFNN